MIAYTAFTTSAAMLVVACCCWWPTRCSAILQTDTVGPPEVFESSVSNLMTDDKDMTRDVAEMLVAAQMLGDESGQTGLKLMNALRTMDDIQKITTDLYGQTYDDFLDLYPSWRTYLLTQEPAAKDKAFQEYKTLVDRYTEGQKELIQDLGFIVALQKALLPSNVYVDPSYRIAPAKDTLAILNEFVD